MQAQPNARFWIWTPGGPVKITLRPGQTLRHYQGHATDEGWASEADTWTHQGEFVTNDWCHDGSDCDGRLTRVGSRECKITQLREVPPNYEWMTAEEAELNVIYPQWCEVSRSQRDEYAELAGY
jgi:hypothetical protein